MDGAKGSGCLGRLLSERGSGEDTGSVVALLGSAMVGVEGWVAAFLAGVFIIEVDFDAGFFCSFASLWALVVKLNLTFFMPLVKLSISDILEPEGCLDGNIALLVLGGTSIVPSFPSDTRPLSANGDFRRTGAAFGASDRGWAGVLVFFITIGGTEWPLELVEESGRGPEEVLGLDDRPLDGVL